MYKSFRTYNARAIVANHFGTITNRIDIHSEELLARTSDPSLKHKINVQRQRLIDNIQRIEDFNLRNCAESGQEVFELKWSRLIQNDHLTYERKIDVLEATLIKTDCVLMEDICFEIGVSLWITNWYIRQEDQAILGHFDAHGSEKINIVIEVKRLDKGSIRMFCLLNELKVCEPCVSIIKDFRHIDLGSTKSLEIERVRVVKKMRNSAFSELKHLETLKWAQFRMNSTGFIHQLVNLKRLDLSSNKLGRITPNIFAGLALLDSLDLSCNSLRQVYAFKLPNLSELRLDHNKLRSLEAEIFVCLSQLTKLYLNMNKLVHADFVHLKRLEILNLANNKLTSLNLAHAGGLKRLDLRDNAFKHLDANFEHIESLSLDVDLLARLNATVLKNVRKIELYGKDLKEIECSLVVAKLGWSEPILSVKHLISILHAECEVLRSN